MPTPAPETATVAVTGKPTPAIAESLASRIARFIVVLALVLAATFLFGLAVLGWIPDAREALADSSKDASAVARVLTVAFILVAPVTLIALAQRRRRLAWPTLALCWVIIVPIFVWLAWDEPAVRRPLTIEEIAPAFEGAEKSYAFLMRYSKQHPSEEAKAFSKFKSSINQWSAARPNEPEKWIEFVTKNRPAIEADWTALQPQRTWLLGLNGFDRIGDLGAARFDADIIRFDVWRILSQRASAIATLQALDGRGEEALATILPYLEVSRKLEPSARTLVRFMVARVVQRLSLETITFILNRHTPTAASRARLTAAVAGGNSAAGARRLALVEYPYFATTAREMALGTQFGILRTDRLAVAAPLDIIGPFVFNPIATVNRYGDYLYELASLAEARELGKFAVRASTFQSDLTRHGGPKNLGGSMLLVMATPALEKVLKTYWEIEDIRLALHARLTAQTG